MHRIASCIGEKRGNNCLGDSTTGRGERATAECQVVCSNEAYDHRLKLGKSGSEDECHSLVSPYRNSTIARRLRTMFRQC